MPGHRSVADEDAELLDADTLRALERLTLSSLDAVIAGAGGDRERVQLGLGLEFADYRHYAPGDDLRRLDWNAYLRLRELLVKVGPQEGRIDVDVLIDTSRSMDSAPAAGKLRYAKLVAAALGAVALLHGDAVRAWKLSDGTAEPGERLDAPRTLALLERGVSRLEAGRATDLAASVRSYRSAGATAELTVLITDALAPATDLAEALQAIPSGALVHVVDPGEATLTQRGPVVLRDRETGRRLELSLTASVATAYERRFARFRRGVQDACAAAGVRYVLAPTDAPVLDVLSGAARLAGLVRA